MDSFGSAESPGGTDAERSASIGAAMGHLARSLQAEHADLEDTLQAITAAAVDAVDGAEHAAITMVTGHGRVQSRAATGSLPKNVDAIQTETGEGPCLQALWEQETVHVEDMATESRWPRFAPRAASLGVGSMLCLQLFVDGDNLGALNLLSPEAGAFGADAASVGLLFATHAAVAMSGARREDQTRTAMDTRDLIGQAKGILMERYRLTPDQAFSLLVRVSQHTHVKVRDLAEQLSLTGQLDVGTSSGGPRSPLHTVGGQRH